MQLEANLAGNIKPYRNLFFFGRRGIVIGQTRQRVPANQMAEEIGFGGFRQVLQIIDLVTAQRLDHERGVVFEGGEVHARSGSCARLAKLAGGQAQDLLQPVDVREKLLVQFDQVRARLAQAAVGFRQPPDASPAGLGEIADAGLTRLASGEHRGWVPHTARFGAMAGRIATACVDLIDGAFDRLPVPRQFVDVPRIPGRQEVEDLPLATGAGGGKSGALRTV